MARIARDNLRVPIEVTGLIKSMQSEHPTPSNTPDEAGPGPAVDALQRRRLLLKGLGKGSAVVAAVVPIQSLAAVDPMAAKLCTVSGVQSNVGSGRTGGTTEQCSGYPQTFFATLLNWPGYVAASGATPASASYTVKGTTYNEQALFSVVFAPGSTTNASMFAVLSAGPSSDRTWAAALLSAIKKQLENKGPSAFGTSGYFPYTPNEVVDLFNSSRKAEAETFFQLYLVP